MLFVKMIMTKVHTPGLCSMVGFNVFEYCIIVFMFRQKKAVGFFIIDYLFKIWPLLMLWQILKVFQQKLKQNCEENISEHLQSYIVLMNPKSNNCYNVWFWDICIKNLYKYGSNFITNNFHRFVIFFQPNFVHLAAGCQPWNRAMAKFSRFTPEATEEEINVNGDSVKPSQWPSLRL